MTTTAANRPVRERKTVTIYSDDNPNTFTVKKKRGHQEEQQDDDVSAARPKKPLRGRRKQTVQEVPEEPTPPPTPPSPKRKRKYRVIEEKNVIVRPNFASDNILAHTVSIQPLLPVKEASKRPSLPAPGKSVPVDLDLPTRMHENALYNPPITVWKTREDDDTYALCGDAVGSVTLYRLTPRLSSLCRIMTSAAKREMERTIKKARVILFPNAILTACWCKTRVAILTLSELECWTVHEELLYSIPVNDAKGNQLHWNSTADKLLWLKADGLLSWVQQAEDDAESTTDAKVHDVVIPEATLVSSAIWDQTETDCILAVLQMGDSSSQLVRYDTCSNTFRQRTDLDLPKAVVTIQQETRGNLSYTFLSTNKGIRLYDTPSLTLLQVFGETVQLHGKTVHWGSCLWMPSPREDGAVSGKKQCWLEHDDELIHRSHAGSPNDFLVVGIPTPQKDPIELESTLYVWKANEPAQPTTLQAPNGGILGMSLNLDASGGWRLVGVTAEFGKAWEWRSNFRSNFAGIQYPVGYRVIDDNIDYLEDEDELDQVVELMEDEDSASPVVEKPAKKQKRRKDEVDPTVDPDLAEALRLSLLEQEKLKETEKKREQDEEEEKDEEVSVLADDDPFGSCLIPICPPRAESNDPLSPSRSPVRKNSVSEPKELELLVVMPQYDVVREEWKKHEEQVKNRPDPEVVAQAAAAAAALAKAKGKRMRTANIETLLQSSIDPALRTSMGEKTTEWSSGKGSSWELRVTPGAGRANVAQSNEKAPQKAAEKTETPSSDSSPALAVEGEKAESMKPPSPHSNGEKATGTVPLIESALKESETGKRSPSISSRVSAEEKELAMELLFLSPTRSASRPPSLAGSTEKVSTEKKAESDHSALTVSTSKVLESMAAAVTPSLRAEALWSTSKSVGDNRSVSCAACLGRMVRHACGLREKPVDYEAIERAEKERKAQEEAEKQRLRAEKRRAAEARRREARKQKKLEEEQKLREEMERMQRLEADNFERNHIREHEDEPIVDQAPNGHTGWRRDSYQPSFSPMNAHSGLSTSHSFQSQGQEAYYQQQSWNNVRTSSDFRGEYQTSHEDGEGTSSDQKERPSFGAQHSFRSSYESEHSYHSQPRSPLPSPASESRAHLDSSRPLVDHKTASAPLSTADALEALAGLATSMPAALPTPTSQGHISPFADQSHHSPSKHGGVDAWGSNAHGSSPRTDGSSSSAHQQKETTATKVDSPIATHEHVDTKLDNMQTPAFDQNRSLGLLASLTCSTQTAMETNGDSGKKADDGAPIAEETRSDETTDAPKVLSSPAAS